MKLIEEIREIGKLYHAQGCDESQIKKAEKDLNMEFPNEYKEYLKEYGAISFFGTEWTGLNVEDYIDVVRVTVKERELNKNFPLKYFHTYYEILSSFQDFPNTLLSQYYTFHF